jgi:hypothetical protein
MNVMGERAEVQNEVKGKNNHTKKSSEFHCIINVLNETSIFLHFTETGREERSYP